MPDTDKPKPERLPWWLTALIGSLGAFVPQLCSFIPQAAGSVLCKLVLSVAVNAFGGGSGAVAPPPQLPPAVECPAERRLSNGYCLPPAVDLKQGP